MENKNREFASEVQILPGAFAVVNKSQVKTLCLG